MQSYSKSLILATFSLSLKDSESHNVGMDTLALSSMADTAWVHQLSPFLIEFWNGVGIRYYGLAYITGFGLAFYFTYWMAKRGRLYMRADEVQDFIVFAAIGTMVGGRLGYVLFYRPDLLFEFEQISVLGMNLPLWSALAVHKGGMASHGGIIGLATASIWFAVDKENSSRQWLLSRWTLGLGYLFGASAKGLAHIFGKKNVFPGLQFRYSPLHVIDVCHFGGPLGVFFGRIANFINGELYGREASPGFSWPVKFPSEIYTWYSNQTDKLRELGPAVEALGEITTRNGERIVADQMLWNQWVGNMSGQAAHYIDLYKEALVAATQSGNIRVVEAMAPALTARYPSQLIQAGLEGLCVFLILMFVWRKPQKPGMITALFGITYPIARIIGEQYRLPDAHIGFQALGMTRGQWLSVGMMAIMIFCLWRVYKSNAEKIGGWKL